jgi:hypothetical protein
MAFLVGDVVLLGGGERLMAILGHCTTDGELGAVAAS